MNKKNLFSSIVIILILFAATLLSGCTDSETTDESGDTGDGDTGDGDTGDGDATTSGLISAKDALDKVKSAVEAWDSDFKIARVRHYGTNQWDDYN